MNPEDQIRMLMEENARLRAQLANNNPYARAKPLGSFNQYGQRPEDLRGAEEMRQWQDEQAYMGGGVSDGMYRVPPSMRKKRPSLSPYLRKE